MEATKVGKKGMILGADISGWKGKRIIGWVEGIRWWGKEKEYRDRYHNRW